MDSNGFNIKHVQVSIYLRVLWLRSSGFRFPKVSYVRLIGWTTLDLEEHFKSVGASASQYSGDMVSRKHA